MHKFSTFRTLTVRVKDTAYGEGNPRKAFESSPPGVINRLKRHALRMATLNAPSPNRLKVLVDQFGRAAEWAAVGKDLSAGMLRDLHPEAKDLYPAALETAASFPKLG